MEITFLFAVLVIIVTIGVPIGFAIGGATILTMLLFTKLDMFVVSQYSFGGVNSFPLMAIPFFILAGAIMGQGGIAKRIVTVANNAAGTLVGGLGAVVTVASMFFAAISGSALATVSAIGGMMIPEMEKNNYSKAYSATLASFAGTIGIIIPPSIPFVIYGVVTQTSIAKLFLAGFIPGVLIGVALIFTNYILCRTQGIGKAIEIVPKVSFSEYIKRLGVSIVKGFWALLSPVVILGGIYSGMFTPTEAAVVSVVYSFAVSVFVYKELDFKGLYKCLVDTAVINGITTFLIGMSTAFAAYLTLQQLPASVTAFLLSLSDNKLVLLLLINVFLLILGCFVDNIPATIILSPILLPAMVKLGVNPIHFGIIITLNLAIGLVTPPYGCNLFVGAAIANIKMQAMFKYIPVYLLPMLVVLGVVTYFEPVCMFLVKALG